MENKEMKQPIPVELEEEELGNVSAGVGEGETINLPQIVPAIADE